ncbi:uncharacterized protein LOC123678090 isoform X2 [Harmonia axyridis]|uniref:uncharacterized protein LOC123678090 isoform X2 n=1 Tax=Harmonia axyridis TaxID=115357 RepID=UPI001E275961|nr:uncharacterized protein LOC123678090 isoform X2 [Harmonia axyridis]
MNKAVTLFVIPFILVQVRSATIPANVVQDGGEGLEDLSPRFYLADNPNFQNTLVGVSLKRNLEKLCDQCKKLPICQGRDDCPRCDKYCQHYDKEPREEVAGEPENDIMRKEAEKDMTLISRFSDSNAMPNEMTAEVKGGDRLLMVHNPMAEVGEKSNIVGGNRDPKISKEFLPNQNQQDGKYYTVGVIKPGLLMNIMLKLINIKQTNDMEKAIILVKSKKALPLTAGIVEKIDVEFLTMLGRELETAEKIHGGSPLDAKDINKILETAYEKAEFKSKSEAQIVSESDDDSIPNIAHEQITRFDDKIVSSPNKMEPNLLHDLVEQNSEDRLSDNSGGMQKNSNMRISNDEQSENMEMNSQDKKDNPPVAMSYVGNARTELSKDSDMKSQDGMMEPEMKENLETKLERKPEDSMEMDADSDDSMEENEKARTFHLKKYKLKKKKGYVHSYGNSYGYNYHHEPYGYMRSNEQQPSPQINQENVDALTGSIQEGLRPLNEDRIGAKDDFQRPQKGLIYKGQGGQKDLPKSQKLRNDESSIRDNQENLDSLDSANNNQEIMMNSDLRARNKDAAYRSSDQIAQINLSEQNKKLDPKKVAIAQPSADSHDGMPNPFHTRIHAHFNKVQDYFNKHPSSETSEPTVGISESENQQEESSPNVQIKTRNNEEANLKTESLQLAESREAQEDTSRLGMSALKEESIDDMSKVGINFQPEDLINLQMPKGNEMKDENMDDMPKVGMSIPTGDLIILQKKHENLNKDDMNSEMSTDLTRTDGSLPMAKAKSSENFDSTSNNIDVSSDLKDQQNQPQFIIDEKDLPGQTVIQVDDQLIDVPKEGKSIFQVNSQPVSVSTNENNQETENFFINQPREIGVGENVGAMNTLPSENLKINPQIMTDESGQNMGIANKQGEDMERSSAKDQLTDEPFPTPKNSPIRKHSSAPAYGGSRSPKVIQVGSKLPSSLNKLEEMTETSTQNLNEVVGQKRTEYENAIEEKIEKLITPREQEFLHNFGKIVPSIEKMHLNSKSDIYFMGNGIKLPLKMVPNKDGSISLSVDLEKLCKCRNSTCAHKMDMINKLDGNLMDLSNDLNNAQNSDTEKHINDLPYMENTTEKKIRKPRNHGDLSKLYKNYRKKYHRLHRRSVPDEYFSRFKEIEQGLEKKLNELNENVKKSNREYDNMLQKGTKDLLQIKNEDQLIKQRIELVNDLIKWMKEMASEVSNVGDKKSNEKHLHILSS